MTPTTYDRWRRGFQSGEQAAVSAWRSVNKLSEQVERLEKENERLRKERGEEVPHG